MKPEHLHDVLWRRVTVLGSTGSIGTSTLSVISHARKHFGSGSFPIEALTAQNNVESLAAQALEYRPAKAVIGESSLYGRLCDLLKGSAIEVSAGAEAVVEAASGVTDITMVAIVGAAGLAPALAAVRRGGMIALANKECVVAAGGVFRAAMQQSRAIIIPVDSEHNAAFQVLDFNQEYAVERVTLTASGGPFRTWPRERIARATPEQAVAHPNWSMGAKISVDSATLMNKGLELIEAQHLFGLAPDKLDVIVHPQSIIHCLVYYADGSTLAHMSAPDMRTPIAVALGWPRRIASPAQRLDLVTTGALTFENADRQKFPCLALAETCLHTGAAAPTVLNAANEVAVQAFLARQISFPAIAGVVEDALDRLDGRSAGGNLAEVVAIDAEAREIAEAATLRRAA